MAIVGSVLLGLMGRPALGQFDRTGTQWAPFLEWSLENPSFTGNPYDLIATVTFTYEASGETHTTGMFYDGANTWKFRFTGTRAGTWTFMTSSSDSDLNGKSGTVTINPNPGVPGSVTNFGNKWGRLGVNEAFVPQFLMYSSPHLFYNNPNQINADIQTFMVEHGFTGFHVPVFCRWFDIDQDTCSDISVPDPDRRTFEALDLLITKVHASGGVVHLWAWGDDSRRQNPNFLPDGINGTEDKRLQRYIAARLGPLPGWTMGYGFDLFEWITGSQLTAWHNYMQNHLGWKHYLGARSSKNQLNQLSEAMDYSSYEQHRPDYDKYVETIETRPQKPSFSEDRFRIRGRDKDYTMEETRRGLWHSTMAGGVANIWGNLKGEGAGANTGEATSAPYPNPEWIKTNAEFFKNRFTNDLLRCNALTDGVCLKRPDDTHYVFYKESASSIRMNLSGMAGSQRAVVVDAKLPYAEIELGMLSPADQIWTAPYPSDWAISVGDLNAPQPPDTTPPTIAITSPTAGSAISCTVTISASASDNVGIQSVRFELDGAVIATDPISPYSTSWVTTAVAGGPHSLTAVATDTSGNATTSSPVTVSVSNVTACIINLTVASGRAYDVENRLADGTQAYIDRSFAYSDVPTWLEDATYIKTANDDKLNQADPFLSFDLSQAASVYVAHDNRYQIKPDWLLEFADTGEDLTIDVPFSIFHKVFPAGTVILGSNVHPAEPGSMYTVIVGQEAAALPPVSPLNLRVGVP